MTDNEIIKALECCASETAGCTDCPRFPSLWGCSRHNMRDALDLINRQNSNIEELKSKNSSLTSDLTSSRAEIEMIKNDRDFWQDAANFEVGEILKEFAERVKETAVTSITVGGSTYLCVGLHHLDNLVIHGGQIR